MAASGNESLRESGPEEFRDYERERLNNVRITRGMMKSLGKLQLNDPA